MQKTKANLTKRIYNESNEISRKRSVYSKRYRNFDGSETSFLSSEPLHFKCGKGQIPINLKAQKTRDGFEYSQGQCSVKFAKNTDTDDIFSIEKDGLNISISIIPSEKIQHLRTGSRRFNHGVHAVVVKDKRKQGKAKKRHFSPAQESDEHILFSNIANDTDLQYIMSPDRVKENIIIKNRAEAYSFAFLMKTEGLKAIIDNEKKTVTFYNKNESEAAPAFIIPAPFMTDTNGEYSDAVTYNVNKSGQDTYIFEIIADASWINDSRRLFPVTVDPQIISGINQYIQISGKYIDLDIQKIKSEYKEMGNSKIINANILLTRKNKSGVYSDSYVYFNGKIIDYLKGDSKKSEYCINITEELNYAINNNLNKLELMLNAADGSNNYLAFNDIYSLTEKPVLRIDYISKLVNADNNAYIKNEIAKAGTGNINIATGNLTFEHSDTSALNKLLPISISHVYNSFLVDYDNKIYSQNDDGNPEAVEKIIPSDFGCGKGWKLNIQQYLIKQNKTEGDERQSDVYIYIDGRGNHHYFDEKFYYESGDKKIYVTRSEITISLDGKLTYNTKTEKKDIKTELKSTSGLSLKSEHTDFKDLHLVEMRPEELAKIEEEIKRLKNYKAELEFNKSDFENQKEQENLKLSIDAATVEYEKLSLDLEQESYNLENELANIEESSAQIESILLDLDKQSAEIEGDLASIEQDSFSLEDDSMSLENYSLMTEDEKTKRQNLLNAQSSLNSAYDNNSNLKTQRSANDSASDAVQTKSIELAEKDDSTLGALQNSAFTAQKNYRSASYSYSDTIDTRSTAVRNQSFTMETNAFIKQKEMESRKAALLAQKAAILIKQKAIATKKSELRSRQNTIRADRASVLIRQENFKKSKAAFKIKQQDLLKKRKQLSENQSKYKLFSDKTQKMREEFQFNSILQNLEEVNNNLIKLEFQHSKMLDQIPSDYIFDADGNILGFDKKGRLNVVADRFQNHVLIEYDDNKILRVIDKDENSIDFEYDDSGNIAKITDAENKAALFTYDGNKLVKIGFEGAESINGFSESLYTYTGDYLSSVRDISGYKAQYSYDNLGRITKAQELSCIKNISDGVYETIDSLSGGKYTANGEAKVLTEYSFEYNEGYSSRVTDIDGNKTVYVFDNFGRPVTVYESPVQDFIKNIGQAKSVSFSYENGRKTVSAAERQSDNLLKDVIFDGFIYDLKSNKYLSDKTFTGSHSGYLSSYAVLRGIDGAAQIKASPAEGTVLCKELKLKPNGTNVDIFLGGEMGLAEKTVTIKKSDLGSLVFSGFAKADSAFIHTNRNTNYASHDFDNIEIDTFDEYKEKRRFELSAMVKYADGFSEQFFNSFDWRCQAWQKTALPIRIYAERQPVSITLCVDYSFNVNIAEFSNLSLKVCDVEYAEFDAEGKKTFSTDGSNCVEYLYNDKNLLTTAVLTDEEGKIFKNIFDYDKAGRRIRSEDYKGIISEQSYDSEGRQEKSISYHKDDPSSKIIAEKKYDEKGRVIAESDERGKSGDKELWHTKEYETNTSVIAKTITPKGNETCYGYDKTREKLLSLSSSADGQDNINLLYYTGGFVTAVEHNGLKVSYEYDYKGRKTKVLLGGQSYISTEYFDLQDKCEKIVSTLISEEQFELINDAKGNMLSVSYIGKNKEKAMLAENIYDSFDNLVKNTDHMAKLQTEFVYNGDGDAVEAVTKNLSGSLVLTLKNEFDAKDRLTASILQTPSESRNYAYEYSAKAGEHELTGITLPTSAKQFIGKDKLGRSIGTVLKSEQKEILYERISYHKSGERTTNFVSAIHYGRKGASNENLRYYYDENGNISEVRLNGQTINKYAYDGVQRLVREDNKLLDATVTYSYDDCGNILHKTIYPFSLWGNLSGGVETTYSYRTEGWKDQLLERKTNGGIETFVYDTIGNPTTYRNHKLKWERGRNLASYDDIQYEYNAQGLRIGKTVNGSKIKYLYSGDKLMCAERKNSVTWFNYGVSGITGITVGGIDYYYQKNLQDDVINILDCAGNIVVKYAYDAWGNHKIAEDTSGTSLGLINPIRYRSYFYDSETKLYYLKSRYYDPELGRFINADDISELDPEKINGLNLYAYCGSNPVRNSDPNGRGWLSDLWNGIKTGLIIAGAVIVSGLSIALGAFCLSIGLTPLGGALIGFGVGSLVGGVYSAVVGGSFTDGWLVGGVAGAIAGAVIGTFGFALLAGWAANGVVSGLIGGFVSMASGDGFLSGFTTGAAIGILGSGGVVGSVVAGVVATGISLINSKAKTGKFEWGRALTSGLFTTILALASYGIGKGLERVGVAAKGFETSIIANYLGIVFGVIGGVIGAIIEAWR